MSDDSSRMPPPSDFGPPPGPPPGQFQPAHAPWQSESPRQDQGAPPPPGQYQPVAVGPGMPPGLAAYGAGGHGWQQPLFQAYRPGIIRLQALGLGDVLDGAIRAIRFNPKAMIGLSLLVLAAFLLVSAVLSAAALQLVRGVSVGEAAAGEEALAAMSTLSVSVGPALFGGLATVLLTGLLVHVVGEAVLGRRVGLGDTWRTTRGRLLPLLGLNLILAAAMALAAVAVLLPGVWLLVDDQVGAGLAVLLIGGGIVIAAVVWLGVRVMLAGPALVLERAGIRSALTRSWRLTSGAFWRLLGISLLAAVIASVVGYLLQIPFSVATVVLIGLSGSGMENAVLGTMFIQHLAVLLSAAVTTPFQAAVTGLLYVDRRIRLEALDVVLVQAAQAGLRQH